MAAHSFGVCPHAPTVRVKELASTPGGDQYAQALRELFDLDAATAESVVTPRARRAGGTPLGGSTGRPGDGVSA